MRADDIGMFWERIAEPKTKAASKLPRVLPETPETGWRPPTAFPDLSAARRIAIDVETKDLDLDELGPGVRRGGKIVGLAVGVDDAQWYFPMRHEIEPQYNMNPDAVLAWAKDSLKSDVPKIGANLLYDMDFLAEEGVTVGGDWLDVQIAEPLLDENRRTYALESLGHKYLGEGKRADEMERWIKRAYGTKRYRAEIWRTSPRLVGPYGEGDASMPLAILDQQEKALSREGLDELWRVETEILPLLLAMRRGGVRVDMKRAQVVDDELTQAIDLAQARLKAAAGFEVNINAGIQLQRLFDKLGVAYPKTAKGNASFTKEWLEHHPHPVCQLIIEQRKLTKYRDTFIRGYIFKTVIGDRIHCLFHSMRGDENGTVSGRFSSSLPNLQNIPIRDEVWGPRIRSIFIPDEGCEWLRHDWSQIEYRFLAHFGIGDNAEEVRRMYRDNPATDFHMMVVELTGLDRKPAKNVNFGLVYGMGTKLLASTLDMTIERATREVFDVYHARVPFVKDTYDRASQRALARGYVLTIMKRRARFDLWQKTNAYGEEAEGLPEDEAREKWGARIKRAFTHKALNRVLQGSAADLMKKAMVMIWKSGVYRVIPVAHLTVHDELDHSKDKSKAAEEAAREIKRIMESALKLKVPIIAAEERGPSWGECK